MFHTLPWKINDSLLMFVEYTIPLRILPTASYLENALKKINMRLEINMPIRTLFQHLLLDIHLFRVILSFVFKYLNNITAGIHNLL